MARVKVETVDHIVVNCTDVEKSLAWYCDALGLEPERVDAWRAGDTFFPSVRINAHTIIDLFPTARDGENVNHFCLVIEPTDLDALVASGDFDVSIESVVQKRGTGESAEVVWVTHETTEGDIRKALGVVAQLPVVRDGAEQIILSGQKDDFGNMDYLPGRRGLLVVLPDQVTGLHQLFHISYGGVVRRLQVLERLVQVVDVVVPGRDRPRGRQRPRRARPADRGREAQTHAEDARARHERSP